MPSSVVGCILQTWNTPFYFNWCNFFFFFNLMLYIATVAKVYGNQLNSENSFANSSWISWHSYSDLRGSKPTDVYIINKICIYKKMLPEYTFIYIIIIIMSRRQHGYPWPSLATSPYRSSPLPGLQGYNPYPHRAAVCMFERVVLLLNGHMWGSIRVHHLWARPCFYSSVLHVWCVCVCVYVCVCV